MKSVEITAYALFCATAYYNTSVPKGLRQDTKIWINGPLSADMDLVRHKIPKPIASHTDVKIAIRAMWDVRSLASIRTFRIRFIATLILNLVVDGTGRCGEMLPNTPEKGCKRPIPQMGGYGDMGFP